MRKKQSFQEKMFKQLDIHVLKKRKELKFILYASYKNNKMGHKFVKCRTTEYLEENVGEYLYAFCIWQRILKYNLQV